jgi:hypothetical protein
VDRREPASVDEPPAVPRMRDDVQLAGDHGFMASRPGPPGDGPAVRIGLYCRS